MSRKILLVDDSPVARKILRKCLPDGDYEIHEASDGLSGVRKYEELRPDITFMDLTMPVMDGMEALERIREMDNEALVIVQTADIQMKSVFTAMEKGAFTVLKKPLTRDSVAEALLKAGAALEGRAVNGEAS